MAVPFSPAVKNGSVLDNGVPFGQTGPIGSSRSLIRPGRSRPATDRGTRVVGVQSAALWAVGEARRPGSRAGRERAMRAGRTVGGPAGRADRRRRAGRFRGPKRPEVSRMGPSAAQEEWKKRYQFGLGRPDAGTPSRHPYGADR